ncbi:MAG: HAMP domain-containing histidine kinase [Acidobacteria bacterium]|nr:HAMP domain-containing histidine kinase [Acidobacteriota bacterium]
MVLPGQSRSTALFVALGAVVVTLTIAIQLGWILNWRTGVLLLLGVLFSAVIITGVVLNTVFLVRAIRRNEQHNAFINAVTHELKTPVASIRLFLETMQTRQVDEAKRREFQSVMIQDCDRLLHTIDQVLRAGAAGASTKRVKGGRVNLTEVVTDCLNTARTRHHLTPDALRFSNRLTDSATVMGDPEELRTAITNLIDNAVKYSGGKVDVVVAMEEDAKGNVLVRVQDKGVGVPTEELPHIFKRFYRVPEVVASRVKGLGLGLYIVSAVAKRHGGKVYAESLGKGHGSTFTLQLPAIKDAA